MDDRGWAMAPVASHGRRNRQRHARATSRSALQRVIFVLCAIIYPLSSVFLPTMPAVWGEEPAALFIVHKASGESLTGYLERLDENWSIRLEGSRANPAGSDEAVSLRRARTPLPPPPAGEQVVFSNGDRLPGKVLGLEGERLRFRAALAGDPELTLPLSALAVIWLAAPDASTEAAGEKGSGQLLRQLTAEKRRRDVVRLRNGDVIEGMVTDFTPETLHLEADRKEIKLEARTVAAIALNSDLARPLKPKGTYGHVVLANGCRLALASATADARTLTGRTLFGALIQLPVEQIQALDLYQGRAAYLSDLEPQDYKFRSYLGQVHWTYVRDGSAVPDNPVGGDLVLDGSTFDKGLGMHSESRLSYKLGKAYERFEALVGLDRQAQGKGSARVKVLVDGKALWDKEVTGRSAPQPVRVDLKGAQELTLVVAFGRGGDVQGRVDWADARLIKPK